jgi:hypothetical protein
VDSKKAPDQPIGNAGDLALESRDIGFVFLKDVVKIVELRLSLFV